jgi:hypothetical protein
MMAWDLVYGNRVIHFPRFGVENREATFAMYFLLSYICSLVFSY